MVIDEDDKLFLPVSQASNINKSEQTYKSSVIWKSHLYKLQKQAPTPHAILVTSRFHDCPDFYGLEYHGSITRHDCLSLLCREGSYLVRSSSQAINQYTLSLMFKGQIKHFRLFYEDGKHFVGEKRFINLEDLVSDGLVTYYLEEEAADFLRSMNLEPYLSSPHYTLTRPLRNQLTAEKCGQTSRKLELKQEDTQPDALNQVDNSGDYVEDGNTSESTSNDLLEHIDDLTQERPHRFNSHTFAGLYWCDYCGNFLWGFMLQGVKCQDCGFKAHKQCSIKVPNDCCPDLNSLQCIFGTDLTTSLKHQNPMGTLEVPNIVCLCIAEVEARGLTMEGIYRVSGSQDHVEQLRLAFERDGDKVSLDERTVPDINVIAGVLKLYFRLLPIPLITTECFHKILDSNKLTDPDSRISSIKEALSCLPTAHQATLCQLILHLGRVCEHTAVNKMTATSLSTIFGPTLIQTEPGLEALQPTDLLNLKVCAQEPRVVEMLILQMRDIFL